MLPCAGQGALGLEIRADDADLAERLAGLVHSPTSLAVQAERAVSRALGGSCSMPLAAHAQWEGDSLWLRVALGHPERTESALLRHEARVRVQTEAEARALGEAAAEALRQAGATAYLAGA